MRKNLRLSVLLTGIALSATTFIHAQDRFAYAITDLSKEGHGWHALRKINTQNGEYSDVLLNGTSTNQAAIDAATRKAYQSVADAKYGNYMQPAFSTGVAALAYDKRNNRIYFTPMFIDQLRYIDLKSMQLFYVTDQPFTRSGNMHNDEGKIVTRMVITPRGTGYALSNDGNTFLSFSTGKKLKVTTLGVLVDAPENNGISIHNRATSFGGDMIADDNGNLYVISAMNHVFKINPDTRVATHLGLISGLPRGYTINGVVVNEEGKLLTSSAVYGNAYYTVDPAKWTASVYKIEGGVYKSSDLANSNYLRTPKKNQEVPLITRPEVIANKNISVYPNPVVDNRFTLQLSQLEAGDYNVEMTDVAGRLVTARRVNVTGEQQTVNFNITSTTARGVYMIKVSDRSAKAIFTQKLVIQ